MPETPDTAKEIVKIKQEIGDIKQSQEADMQMTRERYEKLVTDTLADNDTRIAVFLAVDGLKSRKELQDTVGGAQKTVWRAIDHLESRGLILRLEGTKGRSPVYVKPRWVRVLRMDDFVRRRFGGPRQPGSGDSQSNS